MRLLQRILAMLLIAGLLLAATNATDSAKPLPYRQAGLTEAQAAAHLLDRFAFGAKPGEVTAVVEVGLERWLDQQLDGATPDEVIDERMQQFQSYWMTAEELRETYLDFNRVFRMAAEDGALSRTDSTLSMQERREIVRDYARRKELSLERELVAEMRAHKLMRAVLSENQLTEVLTDFWFNHFNVAITDNQARGHVFAYERDAIRPFVLGKFRDMLGATAKHPAMLLYLDNAMSSAPDSVPTTMSLQLDKLRNVEGLQGMRNRRLIDRSMLRLRDQQAEMPERVPSQFRRNRGINENYARELLELHTLGVDGGFVQNDVIEVARAFSGWTVLPLGDRGENVLKRLERGKRVGFEREGLFLFNANAHDAGTKLILGVAFPDGGGREEGELVLDLLAAHESTARHLARKLAIRFVADEPPAALVDRLTQTYLQTHGDLREMIRTIAYSPEFWAPSVRRAKIKSPFELMVSSLRALDAEVRRPHPLLKLLERMGQPLYAYAAPTGYPDRAEFWINTGALLNRMNFGLNLALGQVRGVHFDLLALNQDHEPESPEVALEVYVRLLLPERDIEETVRLLMPALKDPQYSEKIVRSLSDGTGNGMPNRFAGDETNDNSDSRGKVHDHETVLSDSQSLAQIVGLILGSPEFQRR